MKTVTRIDELRVLTEHARTSGSKVGLVPTMGYLHPGHLSLIDQASTECGTVVATIFVNPLQFAVGEDLATYPSDAAGDAAQAEAAGATVLFTPKPAEMYPDGPASVLTVVQVPALATVMEGRSRPTHFAGVSTVVAKLFNIVGPCRAYFGEKDYQQLAIVRRMVEDLSFDVEVIGCPTFRETDGLAMSSRNVYLSDDERRVATILRDALCDGARAVVAGEKSPDVVRRIMSERIASVSLADLDYVEVADARTLRPAEVASMDCRLFGAVKFHKARLIDNLAVGEIVDLDREATVDR